MTPERSGATTIAGRIETIDMRAVPFEVVELVRADRVAAITLTGADGRFEISTRLDDGRYELRLVSRSFRAKQVVDIDGYELTGLLLIASQDPR